MNLSIIVDTLEFTLELSECTVNASSTRRDLTRQREASPLALAAMKKATLRIVAERDENRAKGNENLPLTRFNL
jgi:hypothetical protein